MPSHLKFKIFGFLFILLYSCGIIQKPGIEPVFPEQTFTLLETYEFDLKKLKSVESEKVFGLSTMLLDNNLMVYFFSGSDSSFYLIDLVTTEYVSFDLSSFFANKEAFKPYSMFLPISPTQLLISHTPSEQIFLFDINGKCKLIEKNFGDDLYKELQHLKFSSSRFIKKDNVVYMPRAYTDQGIGSVESRREYFQRPPFSSFDIRSGSCNGLGSFPEDFKSGANLIKDVYCQLCFNFDTTEIVYGFKYSAYLSTVSLDTNYNLNSQLTDKNISFLFPEDSIASNLSKVRTVLIETPSFEGLVSDPYRKVYYRSFKMGIDIKSSDFIPSYYEKPWHLNIYDDNLNLKMVVDMSRSHLSPLNYLATEKGILFMVQPEETDKKNAEILKFELTSIKLDEWVGE